MDSPFRRCDEDQYKSSAMMIVDHSNHQVDERIKKTPPPEIRGFIDQDKRLAAHQNQYPPP
jgi:hypothetical protein